MKEFNYQDYLRYQELKAKEGKSIYQLREPDEKYHVHQPHDKMFKTILSEKYQVVSLLNRILKLKEKLIEDDMERYNSEHINYMFQSSASDIVYKMRKREIFFLIEHQHKIDYSMPKRILEYEVEIIREATAGKRMTKKYHKLPRVIPIVIYTGSGKWNVEKYIEDCQERLSEADSTKLGEYHVVDANDYTNEELEKDKLFLYKALLLERLKTKNKIGEKIAKFAEEETGENNRDMLRKTIACYLGEDFELEERENLLNKIGRGGEKDMFSEVIRRDNERLKKKARQEGRQEGRIEGIKQIVLRMLKNKMDEETIKQMTEITQEELEDIKRKVLT